MPKIDIRRPHQLSMAEARAVVDQVAAVVILQSALEAERAGGKRAGERVAASGRLPGSGTVVDDVGGHEKGRRR